MSKEATAEKQEPKQKSLPEQVAELRQAVFDMALLVLPRTMRERCGCGKLAEKCVTAVHPNALAEKSAQTYLCDSCKIEPGWIPVGVVELDAYQRETVRIANRVAGTLGIKA